jgi:Transposase DDE domain
VARLRRAGASGELTFRMDSGFWSAKLIWRLRCHRMRYSITVRQTKTVRRDRRHPRAPLGRHRPPAGRGSRRSPRLPIGATEQLFPTWRYHAFVTNRVGTMIELDADHRRHTVCELAIRDLKASAGLAQPPSGRFAANAAWLLAATLAHNLLRWTAVIGLGAGNEQTVAKTRARMRWQDRLQEGDEVVGAIRNPR